MRASEGPILTFSGRFRFLSNFFPASAEYEGVVYPTAEHAYQAAKCEDPRYRARVLRESHPGEAKAVGRKARLRPGWEEIKVEVMRGIVRSKFSRSQYLTHLLLDTGDRRLEEGNTWGDRFWGVCWGSGRNELGKILMEVREEIRKEGSA